ncbi:MAG: hybrid sensor histidine kinase/response regulator [Caldimonas sp.]
MNRAGHDRLAESDHVKCLVVDDREENILALSALLRQPGVEVLAASSGTEALELLLIHDVALAFLDVQMPQMDGFELAELIRGSVRTRDVPLIFVTAGSRDLHRVFKGYESGAVDFLYKPIEPHILKSKADVFFQLYRQRRQLARDLHERTETLRMNEMFVAMLGHDLRNPLSAILASASGLEKHAGGDEMLRKISGRMVSSSKRMSRLIDDMLDLARARLGGGIPLAREPVDLSTLASTVVDELRAAHPDSHLEIASAGSAHGTWDPGRMAQVLSNLMTNALLHGSAAQPVHLAIDGTGDDSVVIRVRNDGRIASEVLPHVFDPFRGGATQRGQGSGLGLGLYIVRQIVLAHGGRIEVEGTDSGHTLVHASLPRSGEGAAPAAAGAA